MREELTVRQRRAWMLCAGSVPAVAGCAGISWQWALLGGAFAALVLLLCERLHGKTSGMDLRSCFHAAFGRIAGGALCVLAAVWQLLALARLTHEGGLAFPESGDPTGAGLILLLLAAWCARKDSRVPARCAGVLVLVLGGVYALLLAIAAGGIRGAWLRPWGTARAALLPLAFLLLPGAAWYLHAPAQDGKSGSTALTLLLAPVVFALVTAGNLSPRLAAAEARPFYAMARGLPLPDAVGRLEPMASSALLLGYFCAEALLLRSACDVLGCGHGWTVWLLAAAAAAGSRFTSGVPTAVWTAGAATFWALLPLAALLVVYGKNVGKKTKKVLDKSDTV